MDAKPDKDTLRILIVTDTHLGYVEKDEIRGEDSFRTFDEALKIGKEQSVDMVLHGGDLFEKNRPSRSTIQKTMQILRSRCMGPKLIGFEVVSDQTVNFASGRVNFEDPNLNVALPFFAIHGNHDDPAQFMNLSALDTLSTAGLINYFGRQNNVDDIKIFPVMLKKGETFVAIYGLGHMRDERLYRAFHTKKVKFVRPAGNDKDKWFNIMVIHQNRQQRNRIMKNSIPEEMLPSFIDVVYWAHEHECRVELEESTAGDFYVSQPGAPIATSLSHSESTPKYCGIMDITRDACRLVPMRLHSVRPFIFDELALDDHFDRDVEEQDVFEYLGLKVEEMIKRADLEWPAPEGEVWEPEELEQIKKYEPWRDPANARIPICRLKIDYTGFDKLNISRFGQQFSGKVANPESILHLQRRTYKDENTLVAQPFMYASDNPEDAKNITTIVGELLQEAKTPLVILAEPTFNEAVKDYVDKEDPNAIENFVKKSLRSLQQNLGNKKDVKDVAEMKRFAEMSAQKIRGASYQQQRSQRSIVKEEGASKEEEKAASVAVPESKQSEVNVSSGLRTSRRTGPFSSAPKRPASQDYTYSQPLKKKPRRRRKLINF